jgi:hypothetical protein
LTHHVTCFNCRFYDGRQRDPIAVSELLQRHYSVGELGDGKFVAGLLGLGPAPLKVRLVLNWLRCNFAQCFDKHLSAAVLMVPPFDV